MKPISQQKRFLFFLGMILLFSYKGLFAYPSQLPEGIDPKQVLENAKERREHWEGFDELEFAHMSSLDIRFIQGEHIDFYTDLGKRPEIDEIVTILDDSVGKLIEFFELDPADYQTWHIEAFLINNREPFDIFGAFQRAPDFEHGYSLENRIWVYYTEQEYYNRFLLLHELVHSFMDYTFGPLTPRWYTEGIAEYLGLHRWNGKELTLGIFPDSSEEVPGFGRIELIQEHVKEGTAKSLEEIMAFEPDDYRENDTYAWSWSLVTLLLRSPQYAEKIKVLPWLMTAPDPNRLFCELIGKDKEKLRQDWGKWITTLDYGADFSHFKESLLPAEPAAGTMTIELDAAVPGWQETKISVVKGKKYRIQPKGRFKVYDPRLGHKYPSEANGISIRYYSGFPLGELSFTVLPQKISPEASALYPWNEAVPITAGKEFIPKNSGTLYFRFNTPTGSAHQNEGTVSVTISED